MDTFCVAPVVVGGGGDNNDNDVVVGKDEVVNVSNYDRQVKQSVIDGSDTDSSIMDLLGDWAHDASRLAELKCEWKNAKPYEHIIIDNFLREDVAESVLYTFPDPRTSFWFTYNNPIEVKLANNMLDTLPSECVRVLTGLNRPEMVNLVRSLTGIGNLEADPWLHGGGAHFHPNGGKLDMHLDYSVHPCTGKERRCNLIIYLNKDWKEEYGGGIELWSDDDGALKEPVQKVIPTFNRAVLFRTCDLSYHGLPDPLKCPEGVGRKSMAVYYVADVRPETAHRFKAQYFPLPSEPQSEFLDRLRAIRPHRRIEPEDLVGWPEEYARLRSLGFPAVKATQGDIFDQ